MGVILPAEYQEVEYLESTGAVQWIDVGFPITDTLSMELTFAAVTDTSAKYYMGYYYSNSGDFYLYNSSGKFQIAYGCGYITTSLNVDTNKHTFIFSFDSGNAVVRENDATIASTPKFTPLKTDRHIRIAGSFLENQGKIRTYAFVAYSGANKIAEFIPCYRKSDDKPGMYDIVTGTFFVNVGTGEDFLVGDDVFESISPWLFARRRLFMQKKKLPAAYQEVEYLETAQIGNQYIDSGVFITEDLVFEIDFQLINVVQSRYFMGKYEGTEFYLYSSGETIPYFQTAFGTNWANTTLLADTQRHKFVYQFENGNLVVKDSDTIILTKGKGASANNSIIVAGTPQGARIPCRTYGSKMTKSGVVIQDLVPCYRKADVTPGMYDLITGTFFTNAGTGEFIVGADIN